MEEYVTCRKSSHTLNHETEVTEFWLGDHVSATPHTQTHTGGTV